MRDVVAALLAVCLTIVALNLATSLRWDRRRRDRLRKEVASKGRTILAEVPTDTGLTLFTEDGSTFHYEGRTIPKRSIRAVRILINGAPIAAAVSPKFPNMTTTPVDSFKERPEGLARDRWDVAIETATEPVLVECGSIRERVSQELARRIFEAVKSEIESDRGTSS